MFKKLLNLIKKQCTQIRRIDAKHKVTPFKSKDYDLFFTERWNIFNGFARLKCTNKKDFVNELLALINEVVFGTVFEPWRDRNNHLRYSEHPVCDVTGIEYLGVMYAFKFNSSNMPHGMTLARIKEVQEEVIAVFDLLDYVSFENFSPILETEKLANDIFNSIHTSMDRKEIVEESDFYVWREKDNSKLTEERKSVFMMTRGGCAVYRYLPRNRDWNGKDIFNILKRELPEDMTVSVNWDTPIFLALPETDDLVPAVSVSPIDESEGIYDIMAYLSYDLAEMLEHAIE